MSKLFSYQDKEIVILTRSASASVARIDGIGMSTPATADDHQRLEQIRDRAGKRKVLFFNTAPAKRTLLAPDAPARS